MARLLSGGARLSGTTGTSAIFITLPTAQPSLGQTPSTTTGYTLVTGPTGQLGFTSTLGSLIFKNGVVQTITSGSSLVLRSNGTGTVRLSGNVEIDSQVIFATNAEFTNLRSRNTTVTNLTVEGSLTFTSATTTATFAGGVQISKDLRIDQNLTAYGNVFLSPAAGVVDIRPPVGGSVIINPGSIGTLDNMNIGTVTPASGIFTNLTATNLFVETLSIGGQQATTGTFEKIRITSTEPDALTIAGGATVTNALYAGQLYDNEQRVISRIDVGPGLSISNNNGPNVTLTNTGVISLVAGTDTVVSSTSGNIVIWNKSTLQTVTDRGATTDNQIRLTYATSATYWEDAALVVDNDVGIGGNLYIQGTFYSGGDAVLTTATFGGNLNQGDDILITINTTTGETTFDNTSTLQTVTGRGSSTNRVVYFTNTSNSTSTTTGAVIISGGIAVKKDVYSGGKLFSIDGGVPEYNYQVYTPRVTVSTSTPVSARIGDFWIDPSIGVEYQYIPNGTSTIWIQFTGF